MEKALNLCKEIRGDLKKDWSEDLMDHNLLHVFQSVLNLGVEVEYKNRIICYIIYGYSPESKWLDLKKDRIDNKVSIMKSIGADPLVPIYKSILENDNEIVGISIFNYLEELKDWRWRAVFDLLEYAANMSRAASKKTKEEIRWDETDKENNKQTLSEDVDPSVIVRINKEKGLLLEESLKKREKADEMIEKIRKDFVSTDLATQQDFGFKLSETSRKRNILSWRDYVREKNERNQLRVAQ